MLNLAHLAKLLDTHQPFDALETENIARTRAFLTNIDSATGRSDDPADGGQLTAAGWAIDPQTKQLLVIRNDKLGLWLNPGGKYEAEDCTVIDTVQREVAQEAGITVSAAIELWDVGVIGRDFNPRLPCTFYDLRFLVTADSRLPLRPLEADKQPRWVTLNEVMQLMPDNVQNYRLYRRTEQVFGL